MTITAHIRLPFPVLAPPQLLAVFMRCAHCAQDSVQLPTLNVGFGSEADDPHAIWPLKRHRQPAGLKRLGIGPIAYFTPRWTLITGVNEPAPLAQRKNREKHH
jgi:hypothetical protein